MKCFSELHFLHLSVQSEEPLTQGMRVDMSELLEESYREVNKNNRKVFRRYKDRDVDIEKERGQTSLEM